MADQGRWFKVWTSILDDPHFQELSLEDIGRWALLGAMTKLVGTRGVLEANGAMRRLSEVLRCPKGDLEMVISRLPNVTFETSKRVDGTITVTWRNWRKYQEDSTQAARQKTSRSKKRREEKRVLPPIVPLAKSEGLSPPPERTDRPEPDRRADFQRLLANVSARVGIDPQIGGPHATHVD